MKEASTRFSPWMTHAETAEYIRKPASWLYQCANDSGIPRHRVPTSHEWRYHRSEVDQWMRGELVPVTEIECEPVNDGVKHRNPMYG